MGAGVDCGARRPTRDAFDRGGARSRSRAVAGLRALGLVDAALVDVRKAKAACLCRTVRGGRDAGGPSAGRRFWKLEGRGPDWTHRSATAARDRPVRPCL